jgi:glutamine---fructose-6-phosphate transaminase (isomerizing)
MGSFATEIFEQPDALLATVELVEPQIENLASTLLRIRAGEVQRIVFTGMGGSLSGVYPSVLRLTAGGIDARAIDAAELLHYHAGILSAHTLLIVISQSGRSAEIPGLLELAKRQGAAVLGVTNTPESILHQGSQAALITQAGAETTVASKTYTCTLAALHLLTSAILGDNLEAEMTHITAIAEVIRARLDGWRDQMSGLAEAWAQTGFVEYLARGYSLASAATSALITKESVKIPTESMNAGQFRHGPIELVDERFTGIFFMGEAGTFDLNHKLAADIVRYNGRLALVSPTDAGLAGTTWIQMPDCPPALLPIAEIVPVQLFCVALSMQHGYQPGEFRYSSKVTTQE